MEFDKTADTIYKIALLYSELDNQARAISYFKQLEDYNTDLLNYELAYAQTLEADRQFDEAARVAQEGLLKTEFGFIVAFSLEAGLQSKGPSSCRTLLDGCAECCGAP